VNIKVLKLNCGLKIKKSSSMEQPPLGYSTNIPINWDWLNNNGSTDEEKQQIIEIWKRDENNIPFLVKFDNFKIFG